MDDFISNKLWTFENLMKKNSKRFYHLKRALNSLVEEPPDDPLLIPQPFTHTKPLSLNPIQIYITTTKSKRTKIVKEIPTEKETLQRKIHTTKKRKSISPKRKQVQKSKSKSKPSSKPKPSLNTKQSLNQKPNLDDIEQQYNFFWKEKRYKKSVLSLYFMKWYRRMFKKVYEKRIEIKNEVKPNYNKTFPKVPNQNDDHEEDSFILVCNDEEEEVQIPYNGYQKVISSIKEDLVEDIFDDYIVPKKYKTEKLISPLSKLFCLWRAHLISRILQRGSIIEASKQAFVKQIYLPEDCSLIISNT